jgi:alkane 1-monooxygenase
VTGKLNPQFGGQFSRKFERLLFYTVRYSAVFMPLLVLGGIARGGLATLTGIFIIFGYYFLVEFALWATKLGTVTSNKDEFHHVKPHQPGFSDRYGIIIYGVLQVVLLPVSIALLARPGVTTAELSGGILSLAVMVGSIGGLAGHEYMHRRSLGEKRLGIAVYGSIHYGHFIISHLLGHHREVGLEADWSTARPGESSYRFLWRALVHGYLGAWRLEEEQLKRRGTSFWSIRRLMMKLTLTSATISGLYFIVLGWRGLLIHTIVSIVGVCLMEMVNYMSHYGLTRDIGAEGQRLAVENHHSFESNNKVTNWFIFNAGKHCHHHRQPSEHHYNLVLANENEYLPYGLPLMTLIALVPPAFFRVMNRLT